ncbi:MAG TPA: hypothetical protein VKM55_08840 [Candidatus Lokiarchaeia archaeon]|nr:hypothetical protein [Candidatus Lokiarchaeia archaeon]
METETSEPESIREQDLAAEKIPRLFPIRLGFFSFMFLAFFTISVLILNITSISNFVFPSQDIYQLVLDLIRYPIQNVPVLPQVYDFIVKINDVNYPGVEALYISGGYVLTFLTISFLSTKQRVAQIFFSGRRLKHIPLQILLFFALLIVYLQVLKLFWIFFGTFLGDGGLAIYILITGAGIWVVFQFIALFTAARRSGTRFESSLTRKTGKLSYGFATIAPYIVIGVIISLLIGYILLIDIVHSFLGLDTSIWGSITIAFTFGFIAICFFSSVIAFSSKFRHQKVYDNLVLIATNLVMYPYILFNLAKFFLLPDVSTETSTGGSSSHTVFGQIFLWADLAFTIVLLIWALRSVGKRTGYKFGGLNKHAFIMFMYAALAGQFGIEYLQNRGLPPGFTAVVDSVLNGQYLLVDILVGIAAIVSLLAFSSKKFGLYFRVHEEVSKEDQKRIMFIHDYLKDEFTRRQEPYILTSVYESLAMVMKIDTFAVMQLVEKAKRDHQDMKIEGVKKRYVYFTKA